MVHLEGHGALSLKQDRVSQGLKGISKQPLRTLTRRAISDRGRPASRNDCSNIPRNPTFGWCGRCCPPQMIIRIREEVRLRFAKHRRPASVSLRKNHLIKEQYRWVTGWLCFAFVNEFVEAYADISRHISALASGTNLAFAATPACTQHSHGVDSSGTQSY